jgi:Cleft lip and palate transmembrane protein 1 (CLPTM1)
MENIMGDEITQDQFKEMFYETNFYLVVVTMIVSLLHTVFSTLAIKNGISQCNRIRYSILEKFGFPSWNIGQNALSKLCDRDHRHFVLI